ncbi:uncharacterized protein LOC123548071 [Mercenaria mercenaria]|uniref:uncharacterized protein LOC123548071 n=1 Tax=Mercenaria mercenaria TaxID=6596 RepID=UPI00234FA40E|nr:uncharacterized protein LOC123548071 [Mercenaria mercenaria]XP_045191240.2 uncharacterized protein LOC123548071 [Mercenaria mercenaria]XP_045191241.2 uncharacterized protein LOC123548071 [Mercenaria mercenaria]XP_053407574.1 uncharacterized protein LOC123548071 [Mercenaria mercenaria]XP_053407575.1 uncharacterized protein LOC123548071 [Mercenaria mercenaria]
MCSTCLLNIQKLDCKTIVDIETAGEELVTKKFNEQLIRDLESVVDHCEEREKEIQGLIDRSHSERRELQKYIEDFKHKIIMHFNKCEKDVLREVDTNVKSQVTEFTSQQTVLRDTLQEARESKEILQTVVSHNSKADIFRCTLSITQQLSKFQSNKSKATAKMSTHSVKVSPAFIALLTSMDTHPIMQCKTITSSKTYSSKVNIKTNRDNFLETTEQVARTRDREASDDYTCSSADAEMEESDTKANSTLSNKSGIGTADNSGQSVNAKAPLNATVNTYNNDSQSQHMSEVLQTTPDSRQPFISGIVTLTDGSFVLSVNRCPRLIRAEEDLTYKDTADLSHLPGNMTVLNDKYLVVCLQNADRVAFVSLSPEFKWMRNLKTKYTPKDVHALDTTSLLVSMFDASGKKWYLQKITTNGTIQLDIGKARSILDASQISSLKLTPTSPRYYLQCCKVSNALYCFEANGKDIFKYNVMSPKYLYVDCAGRKIYVLDSFGSVHILTKDGVLLKKINVSEEANGLTCHRKRNILFITRQYSALIGVYDLIR